jgi:predicted anti-sigma-YlaC factor YlaD
MHLDGISSEETNIYVKKHLSECQLCLNEYKKFHEITERKNKMVVSEASSIIRLKKE